MGRGPRGLAGRRRPDEQHQRVGGMAPAGSGGTLSSGTCSASGGRDRLRQPDVDRADVGDSRCTSASSDRAAAMAVSMLVRHRIPSETAARRMAAASRTGPERGDGVLTTSDTSPDAMTSRMSGAPATPSAPAAPASGVTSMTSWPLARSAAAVPAVAAKRYPTRASDAASSAQPGLVAVGDGHQDERTVRSRHRRPERGREERLGQRHPLVAVDADDLARGAHAGSDGRIDALELARREHRRLDRHDPRRRPQPAGPAQLRRASRPARRGSPAPPWARP